SEEENWWRRCLPYCRRDNRSDYYLLCDRKHGQLVLRVCTGGRWTARPTMWAAVAAGGRSLRSGQQVPGGGNGRAAQAILPRTQHCQHHLLQLLRCDALASALVAGA